MPDVKNSHTWRHADENSHSQWTVKYIENFLIETASIHVQTQEWLCHYLQFFAYFSSLIVFLLLLLLFSFVLVAACDILHQKSVILSLIRSENINNAFTIVVMHGENYTAVYTKSCQSKYYMVLFHNNGVVSPTTKHFPIASDIHTVPSNCNTSRLCQIHTQYLPTVKFSVSDTPTVSSNRKMLCQIHPQYIPTVKFSVSDTYTVPSNRKNFRVRYTHSAFQL